MGKPIGHQLHMLNLLLTLSNKSILNHVKQWANLTKGQVVLLQHIENFCWQLCAYLVWFLRYRTSKVDYLTLSFKVIKGRSFGVKWNATYATCITSYQWLLTNKRRSGWFQNQMPLTTSCESLGLNPFQWQNVEIRVLFRCRYERFRCRDESFLKVAHRIFKYILICIAIHVTWIIKPRQIARYFNRYVYFMHLLSVL